MIDSDFDIKWHNARIEMPGTDYQSHYDNYLVRYTFEDVDDCCSYQIAEMRDGKFFLPFKDWDDQSPEELDRLRKEARIIHWAYVDHPDDY